jgi:hypothetical protein
VDDLVQMLVFRRDNAAESPAGASPAGAGPLGAILRFSAHGVSGFHTSDRRWGGDFPCFAREAVSRRLGCPCAFLSGPCGDIAPVEQGIPLAVRRDSPGPGPYVPARYPTPEAAFAEARRQGEAIADCALSAESRGEPEPLARAGSSLLRVELAMRESIPETADEGRAIHKQAAADFERARAAREPLEVLRPLADRMLHASYMPLMHEEYYYASREEIRARRFAVELPRVELNGVLVAGFPGEACQKASFELREALARPVVAVTEMNGDAAYMPPEEEFPDGDYEVNCAIIEPGGLERLIAAHLAAERTACSG